MLADNVRFPLRINGKNSQQIANAEELETQFAQIFTNELKEKIYAIDYNGIDENSDGIFPDGGALWMTTKDNKVKLFVVNAGR